MEVIEQGHIYKLSSFEQNYPDLAESFQTLSFIKKEPIEGSTEMRTVHNGTTNEEVIKVLIDRLRYLNDKFPCIENKLAIANLQVALFHLEERTEQRLKRGVEGKYEK